MATSTLHGPPRNRARQRGKTIAGHEHRPCHATKYHPGTRTEALHPPSIPHPREQSCTNAPTLSQNFEPTIGTQGATKVRHEAPKGTRRRNTAKPSKYRRFRYATQDPYRTPRAQRPLGEKLKRSVVRQFDARSTEPANTHNQITTHMPIAY